MRQIRRRLTFGGRMPAEVGALIALSVVLSIAGAVAERSGYGLVERLAFIPHEVLRGQVYRLVTGAFIEVEPLQLLFSGLMLYWFGRDLAHYWGTRRFLLVYFGTALLSNGLTTVLSLAIHSLARYPFVGNWALTEALVIAWAAAFPDRELRFYFVLPLAGRNLVYVTLGTVAVMALFQGVVPFVPHAFALGFMLLYTRVLLPPRLFRSLESRFARWRRRLRLRARGMRVVGDERPPGPRTPDRKYWN